MCPLGDSGDTVLNCGRRDTEFRIVSPELLRYKLQCLRPFVQSFVWSFRFFLDNTMREREVKDDSQRQ